VLSQIQRLDSLLNDIEQICDPPIGSQASIQFSLACLALVRHRLPQIAEHVRAFSAEHLERPAPLGEVEELLVRCWRYLEENHKNAPLEDPTVSAFRAVICILHAQKHPEERAIVDHLSFFLMLVNNLEPHHQEQESLLRTHFAQCLEAKGSPQMA
jgi:hypothetical protein